MKNQNVDMQVALKYRKAYESGKRAIRRGFERLSPYYGNPWQDWWFCVGWDGLDEDTAWEQFRKLNERAMKEMCPKLGEIYDNV